MCAKIDTAPLDRVFEALSDRHRRFLLIHMHSAESDLFSVEALAEALLERDDALKPDEGRLRRIEIDLHHRHLPTLDGAGFVEFDPRTADVRNREENHGVDVDAPDDQNSDGTLRMSFHSEGLRLCCAAGRFC